jgi:DedD protein
VIAIRYPETDCDSIARNRLGQARDIGFVVIPIAEWSQAPSTVRPLYASRIANLPPAAEAPAAAPQTQAAVPIPVSVPPASAPVPLPVPVLAGYPDHTTAAEPPKDTESSDTALPVVKDEVVSVPVEARPTTMAEEMKPVVPVDTASAPAEPAAEHETATAAHPASDVPAAETPASVADAPAESHPAAAEVTAAESVEDTLPHMAPTTEKIPPKFVPDTLIKAAPKAQPEPVAELAAAGGHWYVQVGAFANADNAHRLERKLQNAGYTVKIVPRETSKGTLLQVRVGGYGSRAALNEVMPKLKADFNVPAVAVSE